MTFLYSLSDISCICLCMTAMICAGLQAGAFVYMLLRSADRSPKRIFADAFQVAVLLQSLAVLILLARTRMDATLMLAPVKDYLILRYSVFALAVTACVPYVITSKNITELLCVPACAVILPVFGSLPSEALTVWLCASLAAMTLRALIIIKKCRGIIKSSLSRDSVKTAVDELHSGILFCKRNGKILLINTRMQRLMISLYGEIFRDGKAFWKKLSMGEAANGCTAKRLDDKTVFVLPDGKVWLFTKCYIYVSGTRYVQVSAADVTEQWNLTRRLTGLRSQLQGRRAELKEMIENIRQLCREEEMLKIRSRFHDVLGQRLALLFRSFREGLEPDEKLLYDFANGLPDELHGRDSVITAEDRLKTLVSMMKGIGVTLNVRGRLPQNESLAWLSADIITEATTNSVRHGMASEIYVDLDRSGGGVEICVTDNGIPPKGPITEGGGLSSIRSKVRLFDGCMTARADPNFTLYISIPGGETA